MNAMISALPDEQALVAQAVAQPAAFAAIYDHYFPRVYNYVRFRVQDAATADDLTAQAFERVLVNLHRYRAAKAPFGAWLFAVVRNVVRDHVRRNKRAGWLSLSALARRASDAPPPEAITSQNEWRRTLLEAVRTLNERDQEVVALRFGAGLPNIEIAKLLGLTANHVNVIVARSIEHLRARLAPSDQ